MEIVLKAKQSKNPLFNFLNYGDKLNPYYKELMGLIKTGRYIPRLRPVFDGSKLPNTIDISVSCLVAFRLCQLLTAFIKPIGWFYYYFSPIRMNRMY